MYAFLIVFALLVFGFADSFGSISMSMIYKELPEDEIIERSFFKQIVFSYLLALGEFENIESYDTFAWIYFIVASMVQLVIMLNMLIAILGKTFEHVQEN